MWRLSSEVVRPGKSGLVFNQSCDEESGEQLSGNKTGFRFREKIRDEIFFMPYRNPTQVGWSSRPRRSG